jgi:TolB-like protein
MKKVLLTLMSSMAFTITLLATQAVNSGESNYNDAGKVNRLVSHISDQLTMNKNFINIKSPIIAITTFVCLDNFKITTRLSNILSENLIHEMQVRGYQVIDFKMMKSIKINKDGDFLFSRNIEKLRKNLNINYALTGTYTEYKDGTVVNARIINLKTHIVLSTAQVFIPKHTARRITRVKRKIVDFTSNTISLSK